MFSFLPVIRPHEVTPDLQNRIVVGTGHRPQRTGGYSEYARTLLAHVAADWLAALKPRGVISGLALGWDSALIEACLDLRIPYVACAPFKDQPSKWPAEAQQRYARYIARAAKFIVCSPGTYAPEKMQIRNERMIDLASKQGPANAVLLSLWDGSPTGGTTNCLRYAQTKGLQIINAWANLQEYVNQK